MAVLLTHKKKNAGYCQREREHFDRLAETQGEIWWGHQTAAAPFRLARRAGMVCDILANRPSPRVLEVGCGAGIFTQALLERMPAMNLMAVDISPKSVEIARERCRGLGENLRLEVGDVTREGVADTSYDDASYDAASYDAIVGNSILHHLRLDHFLPVALKALKPGGCFSFCEPNMLNPQIAVEKNIRPIGRWLQNTADETAFFRWGLKRQLEGAGFVEVRVAPFDFLHPAAPRSILRAVERLGRVMECVPGVREIAGSLHITAHKPR